MPPAIEKMNVVHVGLHVLGTGFVCDHTFYELQFTSRKRSISLRLKFSSVKLVAVFCKCLAIS